jgi:hypothetical protein
MLDVKHQLELDNLERGVHVESGIISPDLSPATLE